MDEKLAHQLLLTICILVWGPKCGLMYYLIINKPSYMLNYDWTPWLAEET